MNAFFVGQRVRLAHPDLGSTVRGLVRGIEGVIAFRGVNVDWNVQFTGFRNPCRDFSDVFPMNSDELEPILPDGHRACDDDFKRDLDRLLERQGIAA